MKKTLVAAIIGLAATASVLAQGKVVLYNYVFGNVLANEIKYGANSGGTPGTSVTIATPYTVGFYYILGNQVATVNAAMAGDGGYGVGMVGAGMTLAATTTGIADANAFNQAGQFAVAGNAPSIIGTSGQFPGTADQTVTIVAIAYNTGSYGAASIRGHSAAFTLTAANINGTGFTPDFSAMPGFAVIGVPEPSTFALAGLGLAGLLIFRRRK